MPAAKEMPALPILLLRARLAVSARYNHALREHGLTEQQWRVLASVSREDCADIATLARRVDLLSPSVSRILRDLEMRGALLRTAGPADARRTVAVITPAGLALIEKAFVDIEPIHARIKDCVGEDEVRELQIRLSRLIDALRTEDVGDEGRGSD